MAIRYWRRGKYEARQLAITVNGKKFHTPAYLPSISSIFARITPGPLIDAVAQIGYPSLLVSAYDVYHASDRDRLLGLLNDYRRKGLLFLDSGGFEAHWRRDGSWGFDQYEEMVNTVPADMYASFDKVGDAAISINSADLSRGLRPEAACVSICHGDSPQKLVESAYEIAKRYQGSHPFIAVPDKECGTTLTEKISTIHRLKEKLVDTDALSCLHVMGCGSPIAAALFSFAGADIFDSSDWYRRVIDAQTMRHLDYDHLELIGCECTACTTFQGEDARVIGHNINFYKSYFDSLRSNIQIRGGLEFLTGKFDDRSIARLDELLKEGVAYGSG
ncbi:MAG: hypothetical protein MPI95_07625 [Nitrosopumilus sp.]|nr:hypothetical protein [Nitrosopumilus sp.]MDA7942268.1 hypothetical protein [Nitrosopumilus sp.]MDA7944124.1 hypothetical protein [Nitrosopumilus sp.]MDA7945530.1 hypothetical protein [Nitrosopumilus sp.]MDA7953829.1 hypothetical protein [Nitrosopumilus sp.]